MTIPSKYPIIAGDITPTVDAITFASGRAIKTFYLADRNSGANYFLSENDNIFSSIGYIKNEDDTAIDLDFDITIEETIITEGDCVVAVPVMLDTINAANVWDRGFAVNVRRVPLGSSESTLVSGSQIIGDQVALNQSDPKIMIYNLDMPRTVFKKGDVLRVTIDSPATATAGPTERRLVVGFDPKARTSLQFRAGAAAQTFQDTSQAILNLPIKLET